MNKNFFIVIIGCMLFLQVVYAQQTTTTQKSVKIGLLINNYSADAARNGAEMAIDIANKKEGTEGLPFQLLVKSMEGPWGTGSKEAVNLVFKEKVWAIIGSHDGRNAHLVEQVIAKTGIVFLSAWATDPTLSQAFVPWYFSCVPNDLQQADALIAEIYKKREINKIAVVSDRGYDAKLASESFFKKTKKIGKTKPMELFYNDFNKDFSNLLEKIDKANLDGIVFFGKSSVSLSFIKQLREKKLNHPVFGTLTLLGENDVRDVELSRVNNVILISSGNIRDEKNLSFKNEFYKKYGRKPGAVASYAFDGVNLIIEAIRNSGFDREKIQEAMSNMLYKGVTGTIRFDENGSRVGSAELIELTDGIPVMVEK